MRRRRFEDHGSEPAPGRGPARTIFAITDAGRDELLELISRSMVSVEQPERPVDLALHFSSLLPVDSVVDLLERRPTALSDYGQALARLVDSTEHSAVGVQELIHDIDEHFATINRAEHEWTQHVLASARKGGHRMVSPSRDTA